MALNLPFSFLLLLFEVGKILCPVNHHLLYLLDLLENYLHWCHDVNFYLLLLKIYCLLEIKNISKIYGDLKALDNVNLKIDKGEWVAIMGPSGSGKSTLMNIIGCMDKPTSGQVILDGQDISNLNNRKLTELHRDKIGLVFQQFHLINYLNAVENVMVAQYYHSMPDEKEALEALERVGLKDRAKHLPSQLSGGEQQRVCIARALINNPEIILADEPTGDLDAENTKEIMRLFREIADQGTMVLMVTHELDTLRYGDLTYSMEQGRLSGPR